MSTTTPYVKHYDTARMHLAGVKASQAWIQELTAAHLLRIQSPIREKPLSDSSTTTEP
jgi:hypothetical protein